MQTAELTTVACMADSESNTSLPSRRRSDSQLYRLALMEADKHKWIESQKAGRDLGDAAIREWSRQYWWRWCRDRWIEHLSGERFWSELDQHDFGLLKRDFHPNTDLIQQIIMRIKQGGENLDIICWAYTTRQDLVQVLEILKLLDINSKRLTFWPS